MDRKRLTMRLAAQKAADKKETAKGVLKREIEGFDYDPSKATILKKALHNINVSLGTMISAMKDLSILRGSDITPDGMLGGRGFIMPFREVKEKISTAITELSNVTDTLADELTNPKWGLSNSEVKSVKKEQEKAEEVAEEAEDALEEKPEEDKEEAIQPDDVKDADEINNYKSLLEGPPSMDKTAKDLSKNILANLVRGE